MRFILGVLLATTGCFAQTPFTIDNALSAPFATSPVPSPAGGKVAWLLNERGQRNIWVASTPDWSGRKITAFGRDDGQEIAEVAWSPDGAYLLFARGGDFETNGDNPDPDLSPGKPDQSIWSVALDGSSPKKLTEGHEPAISPKGDAVAFVRGGQIYVTKPSGQDAAWAVSQKGSASDLRWSPDGRYLAFVSTRREHSFIGIYSPSETSVRYIDASVDRDSDPVWAPDSSRLAYTRVAAQSRIYAFLPRREGEPWSIRIFNLAKGSAEEVFRSDPGPGSLWHPVVADSQLIWTNDNRIVFPWEKTGWCHLYTIPAAGHGAAKELTPGEGEVEHVMATPGGKAVYYSTNVNDIDRRHLWVVDPSGLNAPRQLTSGENIEWNPAPIGDGSTLAFLASSYNERSHAMLRSPDGKLTALAPSTVPTEFPSKSFVKPRPVMITAADGMQIHGQLFMPADARSGERLPALIFFHGGPRRQMLLGSHYMYYYSNAYSMNEFLASQGYIVLSVNYRSGIGYGLNFREAINYGPAGASEFNDVIGAGLFLKTRPDVDPNRIGVWGGSYGGYLTALALSRAPDLFAAGVDFHGVHDWSTLRNFELTGDVGGNPEAVEAVERAARLAFDSSPMASVKTWKGPVLLIHGDDDRDVAFSQTVTLVEALRKQGTPFEELIFPNEIHDFLLHRHWAEAYRATAEFFRRKFGLGLSQ
ncbi:MAG: S9 family peptidase [Bryobacteraceae bacterium]